MNNFFDFFYVIFQKKKKNKLIEIKVHIINPTFIILKINDWSNLS